MLLCCPKDVVQVLLWSKLHQHHCYFCSIWCFPPSLLGIMLITGNVWKCCILTGKYLWFGLEAEPTASKNIILSPKERELELLLFLFFFFLLHPSTLLAVILTSPLLFRCGVWAALYCLGNILNAYLLNACSLPVYIGFSKSACTKLFEVVKSEPWNPQHREIQKRNFMQAIFRYSDVLSDTSNLFEYKGLFLLGT